MRKTGKRIKHSIAVNPLNMKIGAGNSYELDARAALLALSANVHTEQHVINLWVLAEICGSLALQKAKDNERYALAHCATVKRLCGLVKGDNCQRMEYVAISSSVDLLLEWFAIQSNSAISKICQHNLKKIARME